MAPCMAPPFSVEVLAAADTLPAGLPARIHGVVEHFLVVEYKDVAKLLDSRARTLVDLKHLHEGFPFGFVIDGHASAISSVVETAYP